MMSLGRERSFVVNRAFSVSFDGCNLMDNAFCVEKGGVEEGRGLEGLFTRDATRYRIGFALSGRGLEVSAQRC